MDYDGNVYRPFVSGFDNNSVVSTPPSSQRCSGRLAASGSSFNVCALIDMPIPSHLTSVHISHPPLLCLFPDTQRACIPATSLPPSVVTSRRPISSPLARSHSPSSCTSVPVLHPVRRSRRSSSSLSSAYSAYAAYDTVLKL
ncbi:hypothetical protein B0H19DRAFT_1276406 [Mycena capillaripes]|nr:hypothetical protein B0H19DRAFT_1276406 [Mycena capillaripes]